jgi:hypothetical protein
MICRQDEIFGNGNATGGIGLARIHKVVSRPPFPQRQSVHLKNQ